MQCAHLASFLRLVNADIFFFPGIFFVKFESGHPQFYEIHHRGRQHPVSLLGVFIGSRGWSVKYPIGLETRTLRRVTGTSVSSSLASRRNGIVGPAYGGLPSTTPVYVEKVRSQFLSLRHTGRKVLVSQRFLKLTLWWPIFRPILRSGRQRR